jgi:telomeric repeat-binding factor 2-interacting protein 1
MLEPTATTADSEETRRSQSAHATTSRGNEVAAGEKASPQKSEERKRKHSPEPTEPAEHEPKRMASKQQTKATIQHPTPQPPEVVVPHEPLVEKRKSPPRREAPPSPKKAKITTQQSEEAAVNQEPVGGASMGIDNFFLELPFLPPSPSAEEEAPEQDIESWIDNRRREGKGNEAQIIEALRCTSMDPTLADQILESIAAGNGIPADMRGVWTAEDDRTLEARDTREIQRLMDKHGSVCLDYRWEYLNMARAEGLE